jgi:xylan 1,4-beta-xylosidase
VDFVSTHVYANDPAKDVFGSTETIPRTEMVCRAAKKIHDEVTTSRQPGLPIIFSEYNASYKNEPEVTDAVFMGPWVADTIRQCDGLVDSLAYWTLSDVFEEQGVVKQPFYGGYGLIAENDLPKPSYNAFKLLHLLGDQRIAGNSQSSIVTKRADGAIVIAVWNLFAPDEKGESKDVAIALTGATGLHRAVISRLDATHGSLLAVYDSMGRPRYPTVRQSQDLRQAAELPAAEEKELQQGKITLRLPPHGLALIEIR